MATETCGIIVARRWEILGDRADGYLPACALPWNHPGSHAFRTPEGKTFAWEDDWECGCCAPEEDQRCYRYWEIDGAEFGRMLAGGASAS